MSVSIRAAELQTLMNTFEVPLPLISVAVDTVVKVHLQSGTSAGQLRSPLIGLSTLSPCDGGQLIHTVSPSGAVTDAIVAWSRDALNQCEFALSNLASDTLGMHSIWSNRSIAEINTRASLPCTLMPIDFTEELEGMASRSLFTAGEMYQVSPHAVSERLLTAIQALIAPGSHSAAVRAQAFVTLGSIPTLNVAKKVIVTDVSSRPLFNIWMSRQGVSA